MRRSLAAAAGAAALLLPAGNALAEALRAPAKTHPKKQTRKHVRKPAKKKVLRTKKTVSGPQADAGRWGFVEVQLVVRKTTTVVGKRKRVARRIIGVRVPVYPDHTGRSMFISQQALPLLQHEVLTAQFDPNIDLISGATYTSDAFSQSLQAALLEAQKV